MPTGSPRPMRAIATVVVLGLLVATASARAGVTERGAVADTPPTVTITSPAPGSVVSDLVTITAVAVDDVSVRKVQIFVDDVLIGLDRGAGVRWDTSTVADGIHEVTAVATDSAGQKGTDTATVSVGDAGGGGGGGTDQPPTVSITSPAVDAVVSGTVSIAGAAADDVGVASVEVFVDGVSLGFDAGTGVLWDTTTGGTGGGLMGAVGCSQTNDIFVGLGMLGATGFWSRDAVTGYGGGTVLEWGDPASQYWTQFDAALAANPTTTDIWVELCVRDPGTPDPTVEHLAAGETIVAEIAARAPGATIYVSPMNDYDGVECFLTGVDGPAVSRAIADHLVGSGLALPGPTVGPLGPEMVGADFCHANDAGRLFQANQLIAFVAGDGPHTVSVTATDTAGQTATDTITVTVDNAGSGGGGGGTDPTVHIADIDGVIVAAGKRNSAEVTVMVVDQAGLAVADATVTGTWTINGRAFAATCVTATDGSCLVQNTRVTAGVAVVFTVDDVTATGALYDPAANSDPDGDSDGTTITIAPL